MKLPENPILFSQLSPEDRAEGMRLMRECVKESFPDMAEPISDEDLLNAMNKVDLRLVMNREEDEADEDTDDQALTDAIWVTGVRSRVFVGRADVWNFVVEIAFASGWQPQDPETTCPMETFPQSIGRNDAASMARILQGRLCSEHQNQRGVRLFKALIVLLREGPAVIAPGGEPSNEDLFLTEPARPPHLRAVE